MNQAIIQTAETEHWNETWRQVDVKAIDVSAEISTAHPIRREFYKQIGDVNGLRVLDLGCGGGELSVLLAKRGAEVTALDTSEAAVAATQAMAAFNGVNDRVNVHHGEMTSLQKFQFDLIAGIFVLHHLEPFDAACRQLDRLLSPTGRGVFLENNARNPVLMFARKYLVGHFGIPKFGDESEYPFTPSELETLRRTFGHAEASFPWMICLRKLNTYIFRHNSRWNYLMRFNDLCDDALYTFLPASRKLSYEQIISFRRQEKSQV